MSSTAPEPSVLATRQGKLTLALLCGVAFLDFVDASIVNVALPSIRGDLGFSVQRLYVADLLPPLVIMALGLGATFVGVTTAAQAAVPPDRAGLAAALINASTWLGGALGIALFPAIATSRTQDLLAAGVSQPEALTEGFQRALLACAIFVLAAAGMALRATNSRGEPVTKAAEPVPLPETT